MLTWVPKPIIGVISIFLYTCNLLLCSVILYLAALLKLVLWGKHRYQMFERLGHNVAKLWAINNDIIMRLTTRTVWEIDDTSILSVNDWYLLLANHQSWADIIILEKVFVRKIPMLKFFLKKELAWVPLIGSSCWILNFPFMRRHSKAAIEKNPALRTQDLEATRKACEVFKNYPTTIINFAEGTRFTPAKHAFQQSPYTYLLKPKAGGAAFALDAMQGTLHKLINTTIIYEGNKSSAWDFFCGRINKIVVKFEVIPIPATLMGDYQNDAQFREQFQTWLNQLWLAKDKLIAQELQKEVPHSALVNGKNCHS
jgi:1-acyl-sn-glycerol-3-phosphate acyltransferase